jgi:hypothetical protein
MKYLFISLLGLMLASCKPEPEFYINGKPYYTNTYCIEQHLEHNFYGPKFSVECDKYKTDTIEIKLECQK